MSEPPSKRHKPNPDFQKNLSEISELQEQLDNLQDENFEELKHIERKFETLQKPILERRNQIAMTVPNFWLTSLKKHPRLCRLVTGVEEQACLEYLTKIEVVDYENKSGFSIRFYFDDNPYFKNKILTKEYRKHPASFSRHSSIIWKNSHVNLCVSSRNPKHKKKASDSFFGWFATYRSKLENDEIARMFREELWKNPIVFYSLPLHYDLENDPKTDEDTEINLPKRCSNHAMVPKLNVRPLLICGPSGSGKSTILKRMLQEFPDRFGFTVSHTTRKPRPGEVDGLHYHFTDEETMKKAIDEGKFIETARYGGNYYGTSCASVQDIAKSEKIVVLDIEIEGVKQVKKTVLNPWSVFIKPPSVEVLRQRLAGRKTETPECLQRRLNRAEEEMKYGLEPGNFDLVIVNDDLNKAYKQLKDFVVEKVLK